MAAQQSGVLIVSPFRSQLRRHEMGQPLGQSVKCSGCDLLADLAMQAVRRLLTLLAHFQFVKQRPLTFPPWEAPSRCDVTSSGGTVMVQIKVTRMNCGGCAQSVTRAILGVDPSAAVDIDLKQGVVAIATTSESTGAHFAAAIRAAGYGAEPLTLAA